MTKFSTIATRGLSAAAFVLLVAAAPAQAERNAGTSETARPAQAGGGGSSQPSAKPEQVKYCVSDHITGSRMAKKICKTRAQWEAEGVDLGGK